MKENSFTFSIILFTTIVFIYSCSREEDSNSLTAAPPSLSPLEINTTDVTEDSNSLTAATPSLTPV